MQAPKRILYGGSVQKKALSVQKPIGTGSAPGMSGGGRRDSGTAAVTSKNEKAPQAPPMGEKELRTDDGSNSVRHAYICDVLAVSERWMKASRWLSHAEAQAGSVTGP